MSENPGKGDGRQNWYRAYLKTGMVGTYLEQAYYKAGFEAAESLSTRASGNVELRETLDEVKKSKQALLDDDKAVKPGGQTVRQMSVMFAALGRPEQALASPAANTGVCEHGCVDGVIRQKSMGEYSDEHRCPIHGQADTGGEGCVDSRSMNANGWMQACLLAEAVVRREQKHRGNPPCEACDGRGFHPENDKPVPNSNPQAVEAPCPHGCKDGYTYDRDGCYPNECPIHGPRYGKAVKAQGFRDEAVNDFRMDELDAVMYSVDKWLDGEDLKDNPATRAARAREIALCAIGEAGLLEPKPVTSWMPIETCPTDGNNVLVYDTKSGVTHIYMNNKIERDNWTHWMPLPATPSTTAQGGK